MRTSSLLVLGSAAAAVVAIGCTTRTPAPATAPAPAPTRPVSQPTSLPSDTGETPTGGGGGAGRGGRGGGNAGAGQGGAANPLPYNRVVTAQAQTKNGFFKTVKIGDRLLFEIPRSQMNKDVLLVQEIAQTALGAGYDGQAAGNRVLRFERRDNHVLLRGVSNEIIASDTLAPVAGAVNASNVHPIIAIFNVEAYGPDSSAVIDVSRLFTQPPT